MKRIIAILFGILCMCSCFRVGTPGEYCQYLLPGECLANETLGSGSVDIDFYDGQRHFSDGFFHLEFFPRLTGYKSQRSGNRLTLLPDASLYADFERPAKVEKEYMANYNFFCENFRNSGFEVVMLLYSGGAELTADKDFDGHTAGQNLLENMPAVFPNEEIYSKASIEKAGLDFMTDYKCLVPSEWGYGFKSIKDPALLPVPITFTLNMPVKKVNYLEWLNAKQTDPDVPVIYEEITLHGVCKVKY